MLTGVLEVVSHHEAGLAAADDHCWDRFDAIDCLNEREKTIILMRFGLSGSGEYTQKEVADMMGISQSYISRLEKKIIDRLRREMLRQMQC